MSYVITFDIWEVRIMSYYCPLNFSLLAQEKVLSIPFFRDFISKKTPEKEA